MKKIYIASSWKNQHAAECGMAYATGKTMIGLWSKGEGFGLMRKMFNHWCSRYQELLDITKRLL